VKAWLNAYRERLDAMSLRERVLIFLMLAGVLVALAVTSALDPLLAQQKQLSQKLAQTQAQIAAMEAQMSALVEASKFDPDAGNKLRLAQLEAQRNSAYGALANTQQELVSADRMTQMLQDLLVKNTRLKLLGIKTLPVTSLLEPKKSAAADSKTALLAQDSAPVAALGLYRHGVEISVEGSYPDLLAYLAALERLPWRVYWSEANLSAQAYPTSRLTLTLFTLSLDKTWLSV
jgi:MSHA biogenesis protein MshJ